MKPTGLIGHTKRKNVEEHLEDGENLLRGSNGGRLLLPQRIVGDQRATCRMHFHFSHQIIFAFLRNNRPALFLDTSWIR
jgi:hypothetical protein